MEDDTDLPDVGDLDIEEVNTTVFNCVNIFSFGYRPIFCTAGVLTSELSFQPRRSSEPPNLKFIFLLNSYITFFDSYKYTLNMF